MSVVTTSAPFQSVKMPAVDLRQYVGSLISTEGIRTSTDLQVTQRGAGANMSVDVSAGAGVVQDDHGSGGGFYGATFPATTNVAISAADATNPRIDRVVLRIRDQFLGDATSAIDIFVVTGTPTAGATLVNLNGAGAVPGSCLLLANVLVPAASSSVTNANIANVSSVLKMIGANPGYLLASQKYSTLIDLVSSAAETHILQAAGYSIPAGLLGTDGIARVTLWGDVLNNTGANYNMQLKIKLGTTSLYDSGLGINMATSATRRPLRIQFEIGNLGAANSQRMAGTVQIGDVDAVTAGLSWIVDPAPTGNTMATNNWVNTPIGGSSAEDTTTAKTLAVTWTHTNNSALAETRIYKSLIEFI